MYLAVIEDTLV